MARSRLQMSPAVKADLERVVSAAEYAVAHPAPGAMKITIRGYVRQGGKWYVEVLEQDDPEAKALDGAKLIQQVEEAKLHAEWYGSGKATDNDPYGEVERPNDHAIGDVTLGISRKGISGSVQASDDQATEGHAAASGQDSAEADQQGETP